MAVRRPERRPARESEAGETALPIVPLVLAISLVSLLWRLPSFFDPPWVNDEGTYFAVAGAMAHGYRLYADIWENKPPGIYLLYSAVYHPLGASLIAIRLIAAALTTGTVVLTFLLARHSTGVAAGAAAGLFAGLVLGVPFLEGTTGNAEVVVASLTALAVYLALVRRLPFPAGIVMVGAVAFKAPAGYDAAALGLWLLLHRRREVRPYLAGVVLAGVAAVGVVWRAGILEPMVQDAFLYDLGYVGHGNGGSIPWVLSLKVAALLAATLVLRRAPFPYLWLLYAAAGALVSGRFFGHYAIQLVAPLALSLAPVFRRYAGRRLLIGLPAVFLLVACTTALAGWGMAASGHDSILARRLQYYANFARLATGGQPYSAYRDETDDHVGRNERVAEVVRSLPPGRLLVWGNTPWVYVLSGRLPATPYTSALRQPEVPGETRTLRDAVSAGRPSVVVVISPPAPPLGSAATTVVHLYRPVRRVGNAVVYERMPSPPVDSGMGVARVTARASSGTR